MKLIYCNRTSAESLALGQRVARCLEAQGEAVTMDGNYAHTADMIMVTGGDGTILRAVREFGLLGKPFWSVNGGHLGYLTECDPDTMLESLSSVLAGDYALENRMVLHGELSGDAAPPREFFAINEAALHRGGRMRGIKARVRVDGLDVMEITGDGVLISTPTGSTAYNLSAGGPILMPEAEEFVITPVCPHSALRASLVVPGKSRIEVELAIPPENQESGEPLPELIIDGAYRLSAQPGAVASYAAAPWKVKFVRTHRSSFYTRLQNRLAQRTEL